MRIAPSRARCPYRRVLLLLSVALLAACCSIAPPRPQRTYDRIPAQELYALIEGVFASAGFNIFLRDRNRGFLQTSWKESDRKKADEALVERERRMYSAWIDAEYDRLMLYVTLVVEERPRSSPSWRNREIVPEEDPELARLLRDLDLAVERRVTGPTRRGRDARQP